jgi:Na+/melibiose symporter-like transporter
MRELAESRSEEHGGYDVPGAVTVTLGLVSLVYAFTRAAPEGPGSPARWTDPLTLGFFAAAAVLLASFVVIESRTANPLLPLRIVRVPFRAGAYASMIFTGAGLFAMFLFLGLFMQQVLGYPPVKAGLAFLPFSLGVIVGSAMVSRLLPRIGPRPLMVPGLLAAAGGMLLLTRITPQSSYAQDLLPAMVIISLGMAATFVPVSVVALHDVDDEDSGVASATISTSQQIGGSLGTALMNTVAVTAASAFLAADPSLGGAGWEQAATYGFTKAFLVSAVLLVTAAVIAALTIRVGRDAVVAHETAPGVI